ncbi:hypothetical protein PMIN03_001514 [Paraphaeosphaeria minitans]
MPRYLPFFHRWGNVTKYIESEADEAAFHCLDLLRKVLIPELEETFEAWATIKRTGHVEFGDLELAFNPGKLAVYVLDGIRSVGVMREFIQFFFLVVYRWCPIRDANKPRLLRQSFLFNCMGRNSVRR